MHVFISRCTYHGLLRNDIPRSSDEPLVEDLAVVFRQLAVGKFWVSRQVAVLLCKWH